MSARDAGASEAEAEAVSASEPIYPSLVATVAIHPDVDSPAIETSRNLPTTLEELVVVPYDAYVRIDEFARGGLGRIVRAVDQRCGRIVAIKEMLADADAKPNPNAETRFVREALVTANLQHPAIVPVYDVGRWPNGTPFYAMKLVEGRPLSDVIGECQDVASRLRLIPHVIAVADALSYAHGNQVIHRDLKPHNVVCGAHGETVVIDWGLARRLDETEALIPQPHESDPQRTAVGVVMGTPAYMAPEQARGERVDERADVYAIGAILYHVLVGRPPYSGRSSTELVDRVKTEQPARVSDEARGVPADLVAIVERAMARDVSRRYRSAAELVVDLRRFSTGQLVLAHRYTMTQRVRRFVTRHRAAVAIATLAVAAFAVGGTLAARNILVARDRAETEALRADAKRDESRGRLVAAYRDRARAELDSRHPDRALAFAIAAAELGAVDPGLRFIAGRALDVLPALERVVEPVATRARFVPGSHDLVLTTRDAAIRWSSERNAAVWRAADVVGNVFELDPSTLVAAGSDGVRLISVDDGSVHRVASHGSPLLDLSASDSTGRWIAAATSDGSVDLFDAAGRRLVATIPLPGVDDLIAISGDGARLVVGTVSSGAHRLSIVDRTGRRVAELCERCYLAAATDSTIAFAEHPDDPARERVVVADWSGREALRLRRNTDNSLTHIAIDARYIALLMLDGQIELRDRATGTLSWRWSIHGVAYHLRLAGNRLLVLGQHDSITMFDVDNGVELVRWGIDAQAFELSDDKTRMVGTRPSDGVVVAWSISDPPISVFAAAEHRVRTLAFGSAERVIAGSDDGTITSFMPHQAPRVLARTKGEVTALQLLSDQTLLWSASDGTSVLWDLGNARELRRFAGGPHATASPDGRQIATGGSHGEVTTWDRETGRRLLEFALPKPIAALDWSPDGQRLAAIDVTGSVRVWRRDGGLVRTIDPEQAGAQIAFSPDGRWLARAHTGANHALYALEPGVADRPLIAPWDENVAVSFSRDGRRLLLAGAGGVGTWDTATGAPVARIAPNTYIKAARFAADDRLIYAGGIDGYAHVWDAETGLKYLSITAPGEVLGIVVSGDGARVAVLTWGPAIVWRSAPFAGDVDALRRAAQCRIEVEVRDGLVRKRTLATSCERTDGTLAQ